ncbi:MAG TPA: S8 family serine peptidase [Gaiellaceae bacterium]|nr:S8 family serine peptidase [Gaiellaceae bacterium]
MVDTGVQADHPALQGRVLAGYDFVNDDGDASDDNGHGTAVAGIIASACSPCRILPVKVLAANGTGDWGAVAGGIGWAADHGAQVIDLSLGAARAPGVLAAAVSYALAKGVIVVAAAGDDGRNEPFYPAAYSGVVSVAGIDQNGARYPWSNFGAWVTVAAPGCARTAWIGGAYTSDFCGTSTAAPFVAAAAGLARSYAPALTPAAFAAALGASSNPLADGSIAAAGRADASRMLTALGSLQARPNPPAGPSRARTTRRPRRVREP